MSSIIPGQYLPVSSPVHRADPRAKLAFIILSIPAILLTNNTAAMLAITTFCLIITAVSGISPGIYWKSLKPVSAIIIVGLILQILFTPGEPLFNAFFIEITHQGLINGGWLFWRIITLLILGTTVTFTTTPHQLTTALQWLFAPLARTGVPVRDISMIINLVLRFIPAFFEEVSFLYTAYRARGGGPARGKLKDQVNGLAPLIVTLMMNTFRRAHQLALGMEIKCYQVGAANNKRITAKFAPLDYIIISCGLIIFALVVFLRIKGEL